MEYSFDIEHAKRYGVDEAIMIKNFMFWIIKNKANNKNFHDERTWTYNSIEAMSKLFSFWSPKQIRRILNSLINQDILITGNYNKISYDRTLWYAFKDESILPLSKLHLPKRENGKAQTGEPIPDTITDINTNNKQEQSKTKAANAFEKNSEYIKTGLSLWDRWREERKAVNLTTSLIPSQRERDALIELAKMTGCNKEEIIKKIKLYLRCEDSWIRERGYSIQFLPNRFNEITEKKSSDKMTLEEFINECKKSKNRPIKIIGDYAEEIDNDIKDKYTTRGMWNVFIENNLNAAKKLSEFTDNQLSDAMNKIYKADYIKEWKLSTLLKYI